MAYQVILEPSIGQFREIEPRRVHTRINSLGLSLVHKLTCGKRENVIEQQLDENSTSSGIAEPYARKIMEGKNQRGEGSTPVTTACPEARK